jgi:hypothetical protein
MTSQFPKLELPSLPRLMWIVFVTMASIGALSGFGLAVFLLAFLVVPACREGDTSLLRIGLGCLFVLYRSRWKSFDVPVSICPGPSRGLHHLQRILRRCLRAVLS